MHPIGALKDSLAGKPAFIVGNGLSKRSYDIERLREKGPIFACNLAWLDHHVDYLGFRDVMGPHPGSSPGSKNAKQDDFRIIRACCEFPGVKMTHSGEVHHGEESAALRGCKDLYLWEYGLTGRVGDMFWRKNPDEVIRGSTGFILAQIAFKMGADPIVLVGCDATRLPGEASGNTHYDDSQFQPARANFNKFKTQFEWMATVAGERGRRVFKLGPDGALDIPSITLGEIWHKPTNT